MTKEEFYLLHEKHLALLDKIENTASQLHQNVNQLYDRDLPYSFHLKLAAGYVSRFGYLVANNETEMLTLYAAAYFHDSIEDTRTTYNDLIKILKNIENEMSSLIDVTAIAEIVYALTNEKGHNRQERANEAYYQGIRHTPFAPFIKMCDRLANLRYSTLFGFPSRMTAIYKQEHPHFIEAINKGALTPIPDEMYSEAENMLADPIN